MLIWLSSKNPWNITASQLTFCGFGWHFQGSGYLEEVCSICYLLVFLESWKKLILKFCLVVLSPCCCRHPGWPRSIFFSPLMQWLWVGPERLLDASWSPERPSYDSKLGIFNSISTAFKDRREAGCGVKIWSYLCEEASVKSP